MKRAPIGRSGDGQAWVLRGQEYVEPRPMNWGDNLTLVGAIHRRRAGSPSAPGGSAMTAKRFLAWVLNLLVPRLWPGSNRGPRQSLRLISKPPSRAAIRRAGTWVKSLPPSLHRLQSHRIGVGAREEAHQDVRTAHGGRASTRRSARDGTACAPITVRGGLPMPGTADCEFLPGLDTREASPDTDPVLVAAVPSGT